MVCTAKEEMPTKVQPGTWPQTAFPFLNFSVNQVFEMHANQAAPCASQRLQPLRILRRAIPRLLRNDVETGFERRLNHQGHMRPRRYAQPGNLSSTGFHGLREARYITRFGF